MFEAPCFRQGPLSRFLQVVTINDLFFNLIVTSSVIPIHIWRAEWNETEFCISIPPAQLANKLQQAECMQVQVVPSVPVWHYCSYRWPNGSTTSPRRLRWRMSRRYYDCLCCSFPETWHEASSLLIWSLFNSSCCTLLSNLNRIFYVISSPEMFSLLAAFSAPDGIGAMPTFVRTCVSYDGHVAVWYTFSGAHFWSRRCQHLHRWSEQVLFVLLWHFHA